MESQPSVGQRLTQIRKDKNLSQKTVSELTGIARSTISKIENDELTDYLPLAMFYKRTYSVSLEWLLAGDVEKGEEKAAEKASNGNWSQNYKPSNDIRVNSEKAKEISPPANDNPIVQFLMEQVRVLQREKEALNEELQKYRNKESST